MDVRAKSSWFAAVVLLAFALGACVDKKQIIAPPEGAPPPETAQGYLGYSDTTTGTPVCGNCHVGKLAEWEQTKHSHAWADLQASGHADESCEECHTTNSYGNYVTDENVGWVATHDARYHDVQCESCHGPGLTHVTNPDASQPLASLVVGLDVQNGCGQCHQGTHNPFLEEWSQSAHGLVPRASGHIGVDEPCKDCHTGNGALVAWGEEGHYLEEDSLEAAAGHIPITCGVCHDPHDATNDKQLRYPINVASVDDNLCMKCHHYRPEPDLGSNQRGPMSPQGPLLLGSAGWRTPDFGPTSTTIHGTHASSANEDLCVTCHVARLNVTDANGATVFNSTGHLFVPIPCLDADGKPTIDETCTDTQRSFAACARSGCHGDQDAARSAKAVATQRIEDLVDEVNAMVALVPSTEFVNTDSIITTGEGAKFNAKLGALEGSPIHNPFLMEALLTASIKQLQKDYGIAPPLASISLRNILPGTIRSP